MNQQNWKQALKLVDIIDFKWLMIGEGHHVHVERLQRDPAYASNACVAPKRAQPSVAPAGCELALALKAERLLALGDAQAADT